MPAAFEYRELLPRSDEKAAAAARRALERQEVLGAVRPPLELQYGGGGVVQECQCLDSPSATHDVVFALRGEVCRAALCAAAQAPRVPVRLKRDESVLLDDAAAAGALVRKERHCHVKEGCERSRLMDARPSSMPPSPPLTEVDLAVELAVVRAVDRVGEAVAAVRAVEARRVVDAAEDGRALLEDGARARGAPARGALNACGKDRPARAPTHLAQKSSPKHASS